MKYSVLMSVYKGDSPVFLEQALVSIYDDQLRKPDEIVVVFDGPLTTELYEVLEKFESNKTDIVKYYPQAVNQGLGVALRIGSEKCTGDYIFRMDSDDISKPERFLRQIEFLEQNDNIDVLGSSISEFKVSIFEPNQRIRICPSDHNDIVMMGKKRNPMNHVTVCIKNDSLKKCGGYKSLLLLEDYYLWLQMIAAGMKLANLSEPLVSVRIGNGFINKRGSKTRIQGWKVLQNYMLEHHIINRIQAMRNMVFIRVFIYTPSWLKNILYDKILRK